MNDEVELRLKRLEDRIEIEDLIARYGPVVDSGEGTALADMWARDGRYRVGAEHDLVGAEVAALTEIPGHQAYLTRGCGHFLSAPTIRIDGERAQAVNHSMLVLRDGERFVVERLSANHWEFVRTDAGWRVEVRRNELLTGDEVARSLLGEAALGW